MQLPEVTLSPRLVKTAGTPAMTIAAVCKSLESMQIPEYHPSPLLVQPDSAAVTVAAGKQLPASTQLPEYQPPSLLVMHASTTVTIPLATAGRLSASTRAIYTVLGIGTDTLLVEECEYTVLSQAADEAWASILRSRKPGGQPIPLHTFTIKQVSVPVYQPRVAASTAALYRLLGVNTFNLVQEDGSVLTVCAGQLAAAKKELSREPLCSSCGRSSKISTQLNSIAISGLILQDFYLVAPDPLVLEFARLFGAQFALIQSRGHTYWVLKRPAVEFMASLERLHLFA